MNQIEIRSAIGAERKFVGMPTRAEYFRAEADRCEREARKAATATAMFALLDLAAEPREKAARAERDER